MVVVGREDGRLQRLLRSGPVVRHTYKKPYDPGPGVRHTCKKPYDRERWRQVITPGWECEGRCRASPGPGAPLWRDIKFDGSPACPFGKAHAFAVVMVPF